MGVTSRMRPRGSTWVTGWVTVVVTRPLLIIMSKMPSKNKFKEMAQNMAPLNLPSHQSPSVPPPFIIDLPDVTTVDIDGKAMKLSKTELYDMEELGHGQFGQVNKMKHIVSGRVMAVKRIRVTPEQAKSKSLKMEWNVPKESVECPYTILFYGAFFIDNDVWICMELMDRSLERLYQIVYINLNDTIPEDILGIMAYSTLKALTYLHDKLNVMHRDVKPSNILINSQGEIKLCDFGIAGELVNSLARTDIGCRPYLAPERIDEPQKEYDHRSDIWSLGITMYEIAKGEFPYPLKSLRSIFGLIQLVVNGDPPRLHDDRFSDHFKDFIAKCLTKLRDERPRYIELNAHPFIQHMEGVTVDTGQWYTGIMDRYNQLHSTDTTDGITTSLEQTTLTD